jgi:hypothetical protein
MQNSNEFSLNIRDHLTDAEFESLGEHGQYGLADFMSIEGELYMPTFGPMPEFLQDRARAIIEARERVLKSFAPVDPLVQRILRNTYEYREGKVARPRMIEGIPFYEVEGFQYERPRGRRHYYGAKDDRAYYHVDAEIGFDNLEWDEREKEVYNVLDIEEIDPRQIRDYVSDSE